MFIYIYECIVLMKFSIFSLHLRSSQAIMTYEEISSTVIRGWISLCVEKILHLKRILMMIELLGCIIFPDYKI